MFPEPGGMNLMRRVLWGLAPGENGPMPTFYHWLTIWAGPGSVFIEGKKGQHQGRAERGWP